MPPAMRPSSASTPMTIPAMAPPEREADDDGDAVAEPNVESPDPVGNRSVNTGVPVRLRLSDRPDRIDEISPYIDCVSAVMRNCPDEPGPPGRKATLWVAAVVESQS